jgi:hypothetical protein
VTTVADETRRYAAMTSRPWDGSAARFTDEQYQRSCLIDRGGDASIKTRCSLPVLEPDGTINTNALSAAAGRLNQLADVSAAAKAAAKSKLRGLYKAAGMEVPDSLALADDLSRHDFLVALGELETVDLPAIEILAAGGPYFGTGSPPEGDTFDDRHLQALADANNALAEQVKPPIKIGHGKAQKLLRNSGLAADGPGTDEQPAAGWLENFRVESGKLLADARAVPRKIADLMKMQAFRSRSVEMSRIVEQTPSGPGRTFDSVVTALALLGAKAPAVRTLDDILGWYGERGDAADLLLADEADDDVPVLKVEPTVRIETAAADDGVAVDASGADTSAMSETTTTPSGELSDEQIVAFAATFGIEEDDATVRRTAVLDKFKEFAGEIPAATPTPDPVVAAPAEPTPAAAAETPETSERIAQLEVAAALGERAYEERRVERRDANIRVAIGQGRINPAEKDKWSKMFDENEDLAITALLSIPPNPRVTFGSDDPGKPNPSVELLQGVDRAYGSLANALGVVPYSLAAADQGGQS